MSRFGSAHALPRGDGQEAQTAAHGMIAAINRSQAVIEFTTDGRILSANENFLAAMGYGLEEIRGQHHSLFVDAVQRGSAEYRAFWEKLARGEYDAGKYKRLAKGGREIWIQASYNPILDASGRPVKVVKFATDITAAEQAAREALFKSAAFSGASVAMMMIDRDFKVTFVNDATRKLFTENLAAFRTVWPTFNPDAIIGTCIDFFHKNPAHQRQLLGDPSRLPYRTDITVGDLKFALSVTAVFDSNRAYVGNVLEWDNVTAARSNAGSLAALDRSQAIIEFTLDGKIISANQNFLQTVGYSLEEIRGQHHSLFVEPALRASPEYRTFWEKLGRGEFDAGQYKRVGKGGREVWIQASYNPMLDGNGRPFKVIKFATDITEQMTIAFRVQQIADIVISAPRLAAVAADTEGHLAAMQKSILRGVGARNVAVVETLGALHKDLIFGRDVVIINWLTPGDGFVELVRGVRDRRISPDPFVGVIVAASCAFGARIRAALDAGAIAAGISGSGPSVFALCRSAFDADASGKAMKDAFARAGLESTIHKSTADAPGARRV